MPDGPHGGGGVASCRACQHWVPQLSAYLAREVWSGVERTLVVRVVADVKPSAHWALKVQGQLRCQGLPQFALA